MNKTADDARGVKYLHNITYVIYKDGRELAAHKHNELRIEIE